jgi:hypothetical protein
VALAGGGHLLATTVLGVAVAFFGFKLDHHFDEAFHWGVAAALCGLGVWLAFRAPHGRGCAHGAGGASKPLPKATDRAALWGLFLTLTLSPCELFLPVYLTAVPYGWAGVTWLSVILTVATLGTMLTLTWLTLQGVHRLGWSWLATPSPRLVGGLLCILGLAALVNHH